ncbi:MAG TPA: Lrp/AsnC family transcriptional regulator [Stellaceae bacterium]|nr:Lrp/AsnC family transcriptional regulator [Stellaceae bacterium]
MSAKRPHPLDAIDVKILAALQTDGRMTVQKLASTVGLSARPCLERVRRLQAAGIIAGYQAVIDPQRLSRPVTILSEIALENQAARASFERRLKAIEEMVECWEISGPSDYLARFVCADLGRYEALTAELLGDATLGVARIVSHVALRPVRRFEGYPTALLAPRRV